MKNRLNMFLQALLISCACIAATATAADSKGNVKVFYRYTNEQGTKVIAQAIPPQYVRAGYDIITASGDVIKTVAPSPSEEDMQRVNKEKADARAQAKADLQLHRSYSNVSDIDAAKARNLLELNNNINILQTNLVSVKAQLKDQEAHAAAMERSGRKASDEVLNNIKTLRSEEKDVALQIKQREQELKEAADKYDQDKKRFIEITKPAEQEKQGQSKPDQGKASK